MAYVDSSSNTRRTTTAIVVGAIQAGVIYAIVTGLAVQFTERPPSAPMKTHDVTITTPMIPDKLEPPKPKPQTPVERQIVAIKPVVDRGIIIDYVPPPIPKGDNTPGTGIVEGNGTALIDPPKPPPPMATPRLPRPLTPPSTWVSDSDYPARDMREGNQGIARFQLSVGANGRVTDCAIVRSSGSESLDQATCDKVTRRARFDPATDALGNKVSGDYSNAIRWTIPD